jgi:dTMP kinase
MQMGYLIDIEGGDGSGKTEQAKRLFEKLQTDDKQAAYFDFPRYYESRAGKLIGELLTGKHGDFMSIPPYVSALPYAMDRATARPGIEKAFQDGKIVVSNRYTPSNIAHQAAKLPKDEQKTYIEFIEGLEYEELGIPKPSLVFYLAVPTDISAELILKKEKREYLEKQQQSSERDQAERNLAHQDRTRAVFLALASERPNWHVIDCAPEGQLRTIDDIHGEIYSIVQSELPR